MAIRVARMARRFELVSAVGGRSWSATRQARVNAEAERMREAAPASASEAEVEP